MENNEADFQMDEHDIAIQAKVRESFDSNLIVNDKRP